MADNELLADYEDEPEYPSTGAVGGAGDELEKKNYAGIHSSGFRLVIYIFFTRLIRTGATCCGQWLTNTSLL